MMNKVIYGGISIKINDPLLKGWDVRNPIKRNDLPELRRDYNTPGVVLLVDGYFFSVESVSLYEIRNMTLSGWQVFGCSSMGALRALEAAPIGMRGLGVIYRWMRRYEIEDDDEVAQLVHPGNNNPLTLSLVDIRYMMHLLKKAGNNPWVCFEIVNEFKRKPYMERSHTLLKERLINVGFSTEILADLFLQKTLKTLDVYFAVNYLNHYYP